tara:strand:- start:3282 stop:3674 length:393 start_codon:yes stop_codon:yes gene_type:complete
MFTLISIVLIISILFLLIIYKKKIISNKLKHKRIFARENIEKNTRTNLKRFTSQNGFNLIDTKISLSNQKAILRKEMLDLYKGTKEEKIKALNIAAFLSDKSTLSILRLGLKDMDSDIVKLSAKLIQKFK